MCLLPFGKLKLNIFASLNQQYHIPQKVHEKMGKVDGGLVATNRKNIEMAASIL